ncbi:MAG: OmpA family protein [Bacteroidetes bacterium]|nr:OmpA family protein [Bacteroidota bacterium]MDA0903622.1 OmpA family protein [Bacteroidota bacterium]MDA1242624.1 OmpA family protein [Bacteroidota bacterium]
MSLMRALGLVLGCFGGALSFTAQCDDLPARPDKAHKLFVKSLDDKHKLTVEEQLLWVNKALEIHGEDPEMHLHAAELSFLLTREDEGMWEEMAAHLQEALSLCPEERPESMFLRGAMAYRRNATEEALALFSAYVDLPEEVTRRSRRREALSLIPQLVFAVQYHAHEDAPSPEPIPELSLPEDEFLPVLSPDGTIIFFTRAGNYKAKGDFTTTRKELFSWARRASEDEAFDQGTPLGAPFNLGNNYGGAAISINNKLLIIAAGHPVPGNPRNIDLYVTEYQVIQRDELDKPVYAWSPLEWLGGDINTPLGWEAQPAISGDGQTLLFAAAREESTPDDNGNLTMDIFTSERRPDGSWGPATRMPHPINSSAQDKSPFLHPDGRTLYFSSNRLPSGGGYDLWMSQRDSLGQWSDPVNLGLPINSQGDEHGLVVSTHGATGVFASRRPGTRGLDLCSYAMPTPLRPDPVTIVKGDVGWPLPEGEFSLNVEYVKSRRIETVQVSQEDGKFAQVIKLPEGEDVVLTLSGEQIGYQSVVVHEAGEAASSAVSFELQQPDHAKEMFELADVQFGTRDTTLGSRSLVVLRGLANHLQRHDSLALDILGHTDNIGDQDANLLLSKARARVVQAYLISCGVPPNRLSAEGFGEQQPKADNNTEEGRRINRRTEFRWRD